MQEQLLPSRDDPCLIFSYKVTRSSILNNCVFSSSLGKIQVHTTKDKALANGIHLAASSTYSVSNHRENIPKCDMLYGHGKLWMSSNPLT